ncbi:MAG TPA: RNA polymerase sigma factor [Actinomycetota bacterium]|jgi:RNA polymerase sigma-70 factor (ECF subfamily)
MNEGSDPPSETIAERDAAHVVQGRHGEALAASFEDFFEMEHSGLFGSLVLLTRNRAEAEEVMQEAFLKVWERWDVVQGLGNPTGYLYRTAMNTAFSRRRRAAVAAKRAVRAVLRVDPFEEVQNRDEIDRALVKLTPRQRAALVMTDLLGFPPHEVATAMKIKPSTTRVLLARAREVMRQEMSEE